MKEVASLRRRVRKGVVTGCVALVVWLLALPAAFADDLPPGDLPPGDTPSGDVPSGDVKPGDVPPGELPPGDVPSEKPDEKPDKKPTPPEEEEPEDPVPPSDSAPKPEEPKGNVPKLPEPEPSDHDKEPSKNVPEKPDPHEAEKPEPVRNHETTQTPDPIEEVAAKAESVESYGGPLPKTATSYPFISLIGALSSMVGMIILMFSRRGI